MKTAMIVLFVFLQNPVVALAEMSTFAANTYCKFPKDAPGVPNLSARKFNRHIGEMCRLAMEVDKLRLLDAKKTLREKLGMDESDIFPEQ